MKKIFTIIIILTYGLQVQAQDRFDLLTDKEFMFNALHSVIALLVIYLLVVFILSMVRLIMNYNLKKTLLDKDASEQIISQILPQDSYSNALKWFTVLFSVGLGLIAVNFFQPIGMHSIIILVFSIAFGFLGFYFLIRRIN